MSKPMSDGGKGSVRRNEDNDAYRNNFDAIFGKGKKKTMKDFDESDFIEGDDTVDQEEYDDTCTWCGGCGEGDYDGASCRHCHGTGIEPRDGVDDDYV